MFDFTDYIFSQAFFIFLSGTGRREVASIVGRRKLVARVMLEVVIYLREHVSGARKLNKCFVYVSQNNYVNIYRMY